MCDDHGDPFIATLHNLIWAPDLCDMLFSIITLMNSGHTCLFHRGFCTVFFGKKDKNAVTLPHIAQRKHALWGETKEMSNTVILSSRKKIALKLLHQILGHRSTRSLLAGDTSNVW